ncbi:MAG: chromate transporter [Candidatus Gastranaerophilales bacterium]|nr:chromate transporter [Candidatus Gastranaerophilales bacterium]
MKIINLTWLPFSIFLFWVFFKIGMVFFGGGFVIIPIMQTELVNHLHLLTEHQFVDGLIISQLTPGPVAILVTFAGYCIAGYWGALIATFAMFLPGASLMLILSKSYEKIQNSNFLKKIVDTLNPVIIGLLIATAWQMRKITITDKFDIIEVFIAFFLIIRFKTNPLLIVIAYIIVYMGFR